jgi:hypothetical protein
MQWRLYPRLEEGWLLLADRNFYCWQDRCTAQDTGAGLLWRAPEDHEAPPAGAPGTAPTGRSSSTHASRTGCGTRSAGARPCFAASRSQSAVGAT